MTFLWSFLKKHEVNKPKSVCNNLKRNIYYKITNTSENYQNCKVHDILKNLNLLLLLLFL